MFLHLEGHVDALRIRRGGFHDIEYLVIRLGTAKPKNCKSLDHASGVSS